MAPGAWLHARPELRYVLQDKNPVLKDFATEVSKIINDELKEMEKTHTDKEKQVDENMGKTLAQLMFAPEEEEECLRNKAGHLVD